MALCSTIAAILGSPRPAGAATLIATSFEAGEAGAYLPGSLAGQQSWSVQDGAAIVTQGSADAHSGGRGVRLTAVAAPLEVAFTPYSGDVTGARGIVWFDLFFKLRTSTGKRFTISGYDRFGESATRTFVVELDSPVNGTGWVRASERYTKVKLAPYSVGVWHRLTGRVDHDRALYQVSLDGGPPVTLDFREYDVPTASGARVAGIRELHELRFDFGAEGAVGDVDLALDDLYLGNDAPAGIGFPAPAEQHVVQVVQPARATISLSPAGNRFAPGTVLTASLALEPGYRLASWSGALAGTGLTRTLTVDRDAVIGAEIAVDPAAPPPGRRVPVASIAALQQALDQALPGDVIELANGTYHDAGTLTIARGGVADFPVTLRAATRGGARFTGSGSVFVGRTAHVVIEGLVFETTGGPAIEIESSHHVRVTRNTFRLIETARGDWVSIDGAYELPDPFSHDHRIDHNRFEGKTQPGNFVTILGSELPLALSSSSDRIDHNHFLDTAPRIENGKEAIRLGNSDLARSSGRTLIERNLFERCDGDPEIVSVKTSDDTLRANTFRSCQGSVTLRHGDRSTVEGNFFLGALQPGTGGIRIHGYDHRVFNNYLEGLTGTGYEAPLTIPNGDTDDVPTAPADRHVRARSARIAYNTLVGNVHGIQIGQASNGCALPPLDLTLAHNLVRGEREDLVDVFTPPVHASWRGNLMWPSGSASLGISAVAEEIRIADPLLERNGELWKIGAASPAVDAGVGDPESPLRDVEGQVRTTPDVGADERAPGTVLSFPLLPHHVGPDAPEDPLVADVSAPRHGGIELLPNTPNPFSGATQIAFRLERAAHVELVIFDVQGRRIASLIDGALPSGGHSVQWKATELPAGLYLCRLRVGSETRSRSLLRLR